MERLTKRLIEVKVNTVCEIRYEVKGKAIIETLVKRQAKV